MSESAEAIFKRALTLSPKERAALVEKLLASLDQPDPAIDVLWIEKAEDRIQAYEAGEMSEISAEVILKKYKKT